MIGGLAYQASHRQLWLGLLGGPDMVVTYGLDKRQFEPVEGLAPLTKGFSYVHRSIAIEEESVTIGLTKVLGIRPGGIRPVPVSSRSFSLIFKLLSWVGPLIGSCRIVQRKTGGSWHKVSTGSLLSIDICPSDDPGSYYRLSPKGIYRIENGLDRLVLPGRGGFVHRLQMGPKDSFIISDPKGGLFLASPSDKPVFLTQMDDRTETDQATPGVDGIALVQNRWFVGGSRNRASLFVVDLKTKSLKWLEEIEHRPRASAFVASNGDAYVATGVGKVGLYRIGPEKGTIEKLGTLVSEDGIQCHHLHDLVISEDGRIWGGEFFPIDVAHPPWPKRSCRLWEIELD